MAGVVGTLLFGNFTGAQAETSQEVAAQANGCSSTGSPCCALGAGNPRVDGAQIVGQGRFECNFESNYIILYVSLYKNGAEVAYNGASIAPSDNLGPNDVKAPCSSGRWQTVSHVYYQLPWGENRQFYSYSETRTIGIESCLIAKGPSPCPIAGCSEP